MDTWGELAISARGEERRELMSCIETFFLQFRPLSWSVSLYIQNTYRHFHLDIQQALETAYMWQTLLNVL